MTFYKMWASFSVFGGLKARTRSICLQATGLAPNSSACSARSIASLRGLPLIHSDGAGNGWEWLENPQLLYETIGCSIAGRRLATCWWCWLVSQCDTQKKLCNPYKTHSLLKKHWSELGTGEVMDEVRYRSHGLPYPLYRGFCAAQSIHLSSHRWQACPVVP